MKKINCNSIIALLLIFFTVSRSSAQKNYFPYEPTEGNPFGQINPEAPKQLADFAPLIGECDCKSVARKADQSWADTVHMMWRFKYIMNGKAIQDETLKSDGIHSGSIRQYNADSLAWFVTYFSSATSSSIPGVWKGNKVNGEIVLYREQKAPNGLEGSYRLTFYDISKDGYNWKGEWVDKAEKIAYPTWLIFCKKRAGLNG